MIINETEIKDPAGFSYTMRSAAPEDAEDVAGIVKIMVTESDFLPWAPDPGMRDPEYVRSYIERFQAEPRKALITDWKGGELIAICELNNFGDDKSMRHRCTIAPGVRKEYWGTGVGMNLFQTLIRISEEMGYEQVEASVDFRNQRSYGLLHKLGYIDYGIGPRHDKDEDGTYHDVYRLVKWYDPEMDEHERARLGSMARIDPPGAGCVSDSTPDADCASDDTPDGSRGE